MSTVATNDTPTPTDAVDEGDDSERDLIDALVPRQRSRTWGAAIAVAALGLLAVVAVGTTSGTVVPRLSATADSWSAARGVEPTFTFTLHNDGLRPATITAVQLGASGLDHGRISIRLPARLAPHHDISVTATFAGLRCSRVDPSQYASGIRVTARGDLPWATTVTARLISEFTKPFVGWRTYSGTDPLRIGWPAGITQAACAHG
jgi:hypothetical protein